MKYCRSCLQPDTRPNSQFDINGICPACNYSQKLGQVDWEERIDILKELIDQYPRKEGSFHDCIIGVSGGKDSTRQALWIKEKLGLNPLLVCMAYPPEQVSHRGVDNISNLINLGFDVQILSLAPQTWRKLIKAGFRRYSNWAKSTELALYSTVPRLAVRYKIPLVFWGENPALQLGDMNTLGRNGYDGNNLRYMNTLSGGALDWLIEEGFEESELLGYKYPDVKEFDDSEIQIVYLGWFLGDWSLLNNGLHSISHGLKIRNEPPSDTGDLFGYTALDEDWVSLNQMIKYYKFGFGRATDYVNEEIRLGRLARNDAIQIVEAYDGACSDSCIQDFCKYINIKKADFWAQVIQCANTDLFDVHGPADIRPKFEVGKGL